MPSLLLLSYPTIYNITSINHNQHTNTNTNNYNTLQVRDYAIPSTDVTPPGLYEGITKNGIPWGPGGYCKYKDATEYLGEWKSGRRNGNGRHILANGDE